MKKLLFLFFFFSSSSVLLAQENCRVQDELPLKLMSAEIKRSIKTFKKLKPPVYYLSYTYEDTTRQTLLARQGALYSRGDRTTAVSVFARAGSPKMDNTRPLKGGNAEGENSLQVKMGVTPFDDNPLAFKMALWSATQNMAEKAQEGFARVQINSKTASVRQDDSDDFVLPPASMYCHEQEPQSFDLEKIGELLNEVSTLVRGNKFVQDSNFSFSLEQGHRYFTDSVGTQLKTPVLFARLSYNLINLLDDGSELYRFRTYDVINENQLPTKEQLLSDVRQSLEELESYLKPRKPTR